MADFVCKTCNALLGVGNVFCVNCGTSVADSIEQETVIRPTVATRTASSNSPPSASVIIGSLILIGGTFFMAFVGLKESGSSPGTPAVNRANIATPAASTTPDSLILSETSKRTPVPKPTATPIDLDKLRAEVEERGRQQGWNANVTNRVANAMVNSANAMRPANKPANKPANRPASKY